MSRLRMMTMMITNFLGGGFEVFVEVGKRFGVVKSI